MFVLLYSFWQGGFLFYTSIVVPIGTEVLGGASEQGFITRLVTHQMNVCGVVTLAAWLPIVWWESAGQRGWRRSVLIAWLLLALMQVWLFWLHGRLDAMLDVPNHAVNEPELFYTLHRVYLWLVTVQWAVALGLLVALGWKWMSPERSQPAA